jgi:hypothetical protein
MKDLQKQVFVFCLEYAERVDVAQALEGAGRSLVLDPAGNPHLFRGGPAEIQRVHPGSASEKQRADS